MMHARVDAAAHARRKPRRRWWVAATAAGVVLVAAGVAAFVLWPRGGTAITEEQALEAFKSETGYDDGSLIPGGDASGADATTETTVPPAGDTAAAGGDLVPAAADAAPAGGGTAATGTPLPGRPAAGVYSFAASGGETVSIGPASQNRTLAATVTAIVRHSGECWTFTHNLFAEHVETTTYCPGGDGSLRMSAHTKSQKIGVVSAEANMSCAPPDMIGPVAAPTGRWATTCKLQTHTPVFTANVTQTGTTTVTGPETVNVGGVDVPAWHVQERRDASGDFSGHWYDDIWFSTVDHTIVQIARDTEMAGPARFTERSSFTLGSLQPRS